MRILHTADWHLGRIFYNVHLTEDQAHVLDQFVTLAREERAELIIIAGDVFDRAVPPPEAVALWDETLTRLVQETKAHIVVIAGNHDSAERLGLNARLLAASRVHLHTKISQTPLIALEDAHGPVHVHPLPYAEPVLARDRLDKEGAPSIRTHEDVLRQQMARALKASAGAQARHVAVAHATVLGAEKSDTERPLAIGGAEAVSADVFTGCHYVALGHLHRPQAAGADHVRYAGSLLKYSFAEADHHKSVTLVDMDAEGACHIEAISLTPRHDVRCVSGSFEELLARGEADPAREDYILAEITDTAPVYNAMERLRRVWPNLMHVDRKWLTEATHASNRFDSDAVKRLSPLELFAGFYEDMTGKTLNKADRALLASLLAEIERQRREA